MQCGSLGSVDSEDALMLIAVFLFDEDGNLLEARIDELGAPQ
jgi:hypothetical protein